MTTDPADQATGQDKESGFKPRRTPRLAVIDGESALSRQDLYRFDIMIRDVSTCGFMAECAAPVRIGSYVTLDVPGIGEVEAQIRWQIGPRMGGMFLDPISLARCEWTASKAKAAAA
jgi:hypothetical protein